LPHSGIDTILPAKKYPETTDGNKRGARHLRTFEEFGLQNTGDMLQRALLGGYAVPAYNFVNMEQLQAIVQASMRSRSPVILQVSKNVLKYATRELVRNMVRGAMEIIGSSKEPVPVALNLDHGDTPELCRACIEDGFSSVMIDGSSLPFEENVALTKAVVEYAHERGVSVEGELGILSGEEDDRAHEASHFTDPESARRFVRLSGVDSLAVSIGNAHGVTKYRPVQGKVQSPLRLDILEEIERRLPGFPIVLHGASSLPESAVGLINAHGGRVENPAGIPEEQIREAVRGPVCKVNVASDAFLTITAVVRERLHAHPALFDPRKYLGPARDALVEEYLRKNREVLGCAGKA
jgi:fructose-bisphosphate aldolase class II